MLKVVVVEDEPAIRLMLKNILSNMSEVEVVAEASTIDEMEKEILYHRPDAVFLDILLNKQPSLKVIEALEKRKELSFFLVIVTAHFDDFAKQIAGELSVKFPRMTIRKPIDPDSIESAIEQIKQLAEEKNEEEIILSTGRGRMKIQIDNIFYATTSNVTNYIDIFFCDGSDQSFYLSLTKLSSLLPAKRFRKITGSILVNKKWIRLVDIKRNKHVCILQYDSNTIKEFNVNQKKYAELVIELES